MKIIPSETKIYKSLAACCKHQHRLPGGVQPVFNRETGEFIGFASLPSGEYWVTM